MYSNPLKISISEERPLVDQTLVRVAYSIGLEATSYVGENCAPTIVCGSNQEMLTQVITKGVELYRFANNLIIDLPPSQSKLITIGSEVRDGLLLIKGSRNDCFLWDTQGGKDWLKGALLFTVGNLPTKFSLGNPTPNNLKLSIFIAQQTEGALTVSSGGIN
jgi:hypothetical protein